MNDDKPEPNPENILWPETITDEQIETLGPIIFPKFALLWEADVHRIDEASRAAAVAQDREAMVKARNEAKGSECWISRWRERLDRAKDTVRLPQETFKYLARFSG